MKYIPTIQTIMIWIGGIPTIFSAIILTTMIFFSSRNKAFSLTDYRDLRMYNNKLLASEKVLRDRLLNSPAGVQWVYRKWIGEMNYSYLINGG